MGSNDRARCTYSRKLLGMNYWCNKVDTSMSWTLGCTWWTFYPSSFWMALLSLNDQVIIYRHDFVLWRTLWGEYSKLARIPLRIVALSYIHCRSAPDRPWTCTCAMHTCERVILQRDTPCFVSPLSIYNMPGPCLRERHRATVKERFKRIGVFNMKTSVWTANAEIQLG